MFDPATTNTLLIELYVFGIVSHLVLLLSIAQFSRRQREAAGHATSTTAWRYLLAIAITLSVAWPGATVLILVALSPIGPRLADWLELKADQIDPNSPAT